MLLLTLGASLALLLIAGNTQGCELMSHIHSRHCVHVCSEHQFRDKHSLYCTSAVTHIQHCHTVINTPYPYTPNTSTNQTTNNTTPHNTVSQNVALPSPSRSLHRLLHHSHQLPGDLQQRMQAVRCLHHRPRLWEGIQRVV